MIRSNGKNLP